MSGLSATPYFLCFVIGLLGNLASAQTLHKLETDVLLPSVGHQGKTLGAHIESVEMLEGGEAVKIAISLPKRHDSTLEEVIVLGQPIGANVLRPKLKQTKGFEIVNNLKEGRSGLVIYLDKQQNFVLRLNYSEPRPDVEPDVLNYN